MFEPNAAIKLASVAAPQKDVKILPEASPGSVAMLLGTDRRRQTTVAMQIACNAVLGKSVTNDDHDLIFPVTQPASVAFLLTDYTRADVRRSLLPVLTAVAKDEDMAAKLDAEDGLNLFAVAGEDTRAVSSDGHGYVKEGPYFNTLMEMAKSHRLVIVDSLANISGHSLTDDVWMKGTMQVLDRIARESGSTILILHTGERPVGEEASPLYAEGSIWIGKGATSTYVLEASAGCAVPAAQKAEISKSPRVWRLYNWNYITAKTVTDILLEEDTSTELWVKAGNPVRLASRIAAASVPARPTVAVVATPRPAIVPEQVSRPRPVEVNPVPVLSSVVSNGRPAETTIDPLASPADFLRERGQGREHRF